MIENNRQTDPLPKQQDVSSEVRQLFDDAVDRANRQIETERENARTRSPLAKILQIFLIIAALSAISTMAYGIYNFPDAPIRAKDNGNFVGRSGNPHTREQFENFLLWEKAMFITVPAVFVLAFAFSAADSRKRRQ